MGYKEGERLGKSTQFSVDEKQGRNIKDEMLKIQNNESQSESTYSDFAQRQMVCCFFFSSHATNFKLFVCG